MSEDARRLKLVQAAIEALIAAGATEFRPGDVASYQRDKSDPIPVWELRGIFTILSAQGLIEADPSTGAWQMKGDKKSASAG
jgi:hypothetical protein